MKDMVIAKEKLILYRESILKWPYEWAKALCQVYLNNTKENHPNNKHGLVSGREVGGRLGVK